jgi:hypothetical protein
MKMRALSSSLGAAILVSCATIQHADPTEARMPVTPNPMNYESCAASRICTLSGTMTAEPAAHAVMGRLQLPEGRCVSVSLPREQIVELRRGGPKLMTVTGRVYGEPPEDQDTILEIQGRRIGLGLCDDFFVFVPDRNSEPARQLSGQPQGRQ